MKRKFKIKIDMLPMHVHIFIEDLTMFVVVLFVANLLNQPIFFLQRIKPSKVEKVPDLTEMKSNKLKQ